MENIKNHWEKIYNTKNLEEVSWYQAKPETSLSFFEKFNVPKTARIINIGGGDSLLVDYLLELGYTDLTVLDISETALEKAKIRLGNKANIVNWIVANVAEFIPKEKYDFWHDRAAFHFLTDQADIEKYVKILNLNIAPNGHLVVGTFSEKGPTKCSGIEIKQYSKKTLVETIGTYFNKIKCFTENHKTPFDTIQNFVFCSFTKKELAIL